ncbi:unnamed protein product, partial [Sphagnum compactum]
MIGRSISSPTSSRSLEPSMAGIYTSPMTGSNLSLSSLGNSSALVALPHVIIERKYKDVLQLQNPNSSPFLFMHLAAMAPGTVQLDMFPWNRRLARYVKAGQHEKTIELYQEMQQKGMSPDNFTFVPVLNACASLRALEAGRKVHEEIIQSGCEADVFVGSSLVDMYSKCGSIEDACKVFNNMPSRDVVTWNAMILGHVKFGQGQKALELFHQMQQKDVFVGSSLVDMYAKCGTMEDAERVFNKMLSRNVVTWNTMILGYVKCGQGSKALELFQQMQQEVAVVGNSLIDMYAKCGSIEDAKRVFNKLPSRDVVSWNVMIFGHVKYGQGQKALELFRQMQEEGNSLIDMYAKCGSLEDALKVFNKMPSRDVVTWNAMIVGYAIHGHGKEALKQFEQMREEGMRPDRFTFVPVLNACAGLRALEEGRRAHQLIMQTGCEADVFVGSSLVDMYAKCGSMEDAWRVFCKMPSQDVVTWTAMILGYVRCGQGQKALELYKRMQQEGVQPNAVTFVVVLNACASVSALEEGRRTHERVIQSRCESDVFVRNSLVDMYAKCGSMEDACRVFNTMPSHDVVSWNALLGGFAMHGQGKEALVHFERMCEEGVHPDDITFVCLLSACSHAGFVDEGLRFNALMTTVYRIPAKLEHYTCMVDLLGRAGHLQEAENMIQGMPCKPNAAIWRALLGACRIHGNVEMGERMAKRVLELEPKNAAGFVLLSNLYAATGNLELSESVERQRKERDAKKQPGRTWIEVNDAVHTFVVDDQIHPEMIKIRAELKRLSVLMHD